MNERQKFARVIAIFVGVLLILNIIETFMTFFILDNGGIEANPVVNFLLNNIGRIGFFIVKCSIILLFGFTGIKWTKHPILFHKRFLKWTYSWGIVLLTLYYLFVTLFVIAQVLYFKGVLVW